MTYLVFFCCWTFAEIAPQVESWMRSTWMQYLQVFRRGTASKMFVVIPTQLPVAAASQSTTRSREKTSKFESKADTRRASKGEQALEFALSARLAFPD